MASRARRQTAPAADPLPAHFHPQLATPARIPPDGDRWVHEIKFDGYRIGCRIEGGTVQLLSRNNKDWTAKFPEVRKACLQLPVTRAFLDGEVAVLLPNGRTSFQALQNVFRGGSRANLVYFVFDALDIDGDDIARLSLDERKQRLRTLVDTLGPQSLIRYSEHVIGHGPAFLQEACRLGLEGIISKRRDRPYEPGRSPCWLKAKCRKRQEFVIGGFTDPEGSRAGIGALLLGVHDDRGHLLFSGKVGTGFTQTSAHDLRQQLNRIAQKECPFTPRPPGLLGRHARWVQPALVAEVAFSEWTDDGRIRQPSFQGLRDDKDPRDVRREEPAAGAQPRPAPRSSKTETQVSGARLTHPERVLYPDIGFTKLELAHFYEAIADWILPHLTGRPLTLVRCPEGVGASCFFMKHSRMRAPEGLRRVPIQDRKKVSDYLIADSVQGLLGLVQMDILEIHTWNSRVEHLEQPDRIVFDLDPGPDVPWRQVVAGARLVRGVLEALQLASFVKTTGGVGLHVVVPLVPEADWAPCHEFARAVAEAIARRAPAAYTTRFAKAGRERKILLDYLRNTRTNTSVAAYSTRATPRGTVSVPISWDELSTRLHSDHFTVRNLPKRLAGLTDDPWKEYWTVRQRIPPAAIQVLKEI